MIGCKWGERILHYTRSLKSDGLKLLDAVPSTAPVDLTICKLPIPIKTSTTALTLCLFSVCFLFCNSCSPSKLPANLYCVNWIIRLFCIIFQLVIKYSYHKTHASIMMCSRVWGLNREMLACGSCSVCVLASCPMLSLIMKTLTWVPTETGTSAVSPSKTTWSYSTVSSKA